MFGPTEGFEPPLESQVRAVFDLCDQDRNGMVRAGHLENLARFYTSNHSQELSEVLKHFDPTEKGFVNFHEFYNGVCTILKKHQEKSTIKDSMMSPVLDSNTRVNGDISVSAAASPEPRFVVTRSPPSPEKEGLKTRQNGGSQCSSLSDGESFECYGEQELELDSGCHSDRTNGELGSRSPLETNQQINRHTWLRTSLRRSPPSNKENLPNRRWGSFRHSGKRQLGSNALASFNSSGRSSICDTADDMYSDVSLEEDVLDLNHKVQILQQQVGVLTDTANSNDERYTRAKSENAALQARIHMLEEQLRENELRSEERLQEEVRRSKEIISRIERDRSSQIELYSSRIKSLEVEIVELREDAARQRGKAERLEAEREEFIEQIKDMRLEMDRTRNLELNFRETERRLTNERASNSQLIEELSHEVEHLRQISRTPALPTSNPDTLRLEELHEEISALRAENQTLKENNEELQANLLNASVEQGRLLTTRGETSLAAELEAMSHDQLEMQDSDITDSAQNDLVKIQQALKEQQEVNAQLRSYIDGILLNIVENHPQLLEVKKSHF